MKILPYVVKVSTGRLVPLCDSDLEDVLEACQHMLTCGEYSKKQLRNIESYYLSLKSEFQYRQGKRIVSVKPLYSRDSKVSDKPLGIKELTTQEYIEKAASYASWKVKDTIPKFWTRKEGMGRLFCPLPEVLVDHTPLPMDPKKSTKRGKGLTAYAQHQEISKYMKGFGTKPLPTVEVEKLMIAGKDVYEVVEAEIQKKTDFAKALQFELAEAGYKVNLKDLRKALKSPEVTIREFLEGQGVSADTSHKVYYDVVERFHEKGLTNYL